jgi:hypothetical protein
LNKEKEANITFKNVISVLPLPPKVKRKKRKRKKTTCMRERARGKNEKTKNDIFIHQKCMLRFKKN